MKKSRAALTLVRRLGLGLFIIVAAALALLRSDWRHRSPRAGAPRVAIFQYSSNLNLDLGIRGLSDSLRDHGWVDGRTVELRSLSVANSVTWLPASFPAKTQLLFPSFTTFRKSFSLTGVSLHN